MPLFLLLFMLLTQSDRATSLFADNNRVKNQQGIFLDPYGRQLIFHGVNLVNKRPPYDPQSIGLDKKIVDFIEAQGFNLVRLGIYWTAIEKIPGSYDDSYLQKIEEAVELLAQKNIYTLIDFHQDAYSTKHGGLGAPEWAALGNGNFKNPGFPINNFGGLTIGRTKIGPQLDEDFDAFWNNMPAADGIGIQDRYVKMLQHVVSYFKGNTNILGFELMNEPFVGSDWPNCTVSLENLNFSNGCAEFELGKLQNFYQNCIDSIRTIDQETIIFFEPNVFFSFGAPAAFFQLKDETKQIGFSFHNYNNKNDDSPFASIKALETPFQQANLQKMQSQFVSLMTEFGAASTTPQTLEQALALADAYQMSWTYWSLVNNPAYKFYQTTLFPTNPRKQGLIYDMRFPLSGNNVVQPDLVQLSRIYPRVIAGQSASFSFNANLNQFQLEYETNPQNASVLHDTEIFIPLSRYPMGYQVHVQGGYVKSFPGSKILIIAPFFKYKKVQVTVQTQDLTSPQFPTPW